MRISDWSSDMCSSDLCAPANARTGLAFDLRILRYSSRRLSAYRLARLLLDLLNLSRFAIRCSSCCPFQRQLGAGADWPRLALIPSISGWNRSEERRVGTE